MKGVMLSMRVGKSFTTKNHMLLGSPPGMYWLPSEMKAAPLTLRIATIDAFWNTRQSTKLFAISGSPKSEHPNIAFPTGTNSILCACRLKGLPCKLWGRRRVGWGGGESFLKTLALAVWENWQQFWHENPCFKLLMFLGLPCSICWFCLWLFFRKTLTYFCVLVFKQQKTAYLYASYKMKMTQTNTKRTD